MRFTEAELERQRTANEIHDLKRNIRMVVNVLRQVSNGCDDEHTMRATISVLADDLETVCLK